MAVRSGDGYARIMAAHIAFIALTGMSVARAATDALIAKEPEKLPWCGSMYAPPFADMADGQKVRKCESPTPRTYTPLRSNVGKEALDFESKACFVPDQAYRLLDEIIETVKDKVGPTNVSQGHEAERALILNISRTTSKVLAIKGFGLYIPTETLGDALVPRSRLDEQPRHIVDCDTGSLILLSVADALGLRAALVEVTLSSGSGHNFVRWQLTDGSILDWDTNGQAECSMQLNNPPFQGRAMSSKETSAYLLLLAAARFDREGHPKEAAENELQSIGLNPEHPAAYNNFVWTIATKDFPDRSAFRAKAAELTPKLLTIQRLPNYLDTAACMAAYEGDFQKALAFENEALKGDPGNGTFAARVIQLSSAHPHDCTGEK